MHHCYLLAKILCQITFQKFLHFVNGTVVVDDIIWDYKYMILHILWSYGIIKPTEKWNVPNNERILKAVQYLSLINLIKPAKVYVLAHHWHNLTAVSKVPWKEQSSVGTLSQYSSNNNNYYYHYISLLPRSLFYSNREKEHPLLQDSFVEFHTVTKYDLHFYMFSTKAGLSITFFGSFWFTKSWKLRKEECEGPQLMFVHVHGGCTVGGNVKENPPEFHIKESNCSEKQKFFKMQLNHTLKKAFWVHPLMRSKKKI